MNKERKTAVVDEIAEQIGAAEAVFAVDYRGISVPQAADLRARLRDADATFRIVKNRLTLRAAEKAGALSLQDLLEGPTALMFVRGDAATAAKALADFSRRSGVLEFKGGLLGEQTLTIDEIQSIARLPSRDALDAQLLGTVAAPLTGLVRGLNSLLAGVAVQLQQIAEKGLLSQGEAAEPDAADEPAGPSAAEEAAGEESPASEGEEAAEEESSASQEVTQETDEDADASATANEASSEEAAEGGGQAEA